MTGLASLKTAGSDTAKLLDNCNNVINISEYKQSRANTCGPASLRVALKLIGIEVKEAWLARQMSVTKLGTKPSGFRKALRKLGLEYSELTSATIDDVRWFVSKRIPVVVAWTFKGDGHYSLVVSAASDELSMIEPYTGRLIKIDRHRFEKLWHDPCNHTTGWMMAIGPNHRYYTCR